MTPFQGCRICIHMIALVAQNVSWPAISGVCFFMELMKEVHVVTPGTHNHMK